MSGTPSLADVWSVSCPRRVHRRGAWKLLQSWIHLNKAEAAPRGPEPNPREGDFSNTSGRPWSQRSTMFHHVDCKNQQSATGNYLPQLQTACVQRGGSEAEREVLRFFRGGCAPLLELGGFLTPLSRRLSHSSTWSFLRRAGEALSCQPARAQPAPLRGRRDWGEILSVERMSPRGSSLQPGGVLCPGSTQIPINIIYLPERASRPHPLHLMPTPIPSTLWVSAGGNLMYAGNYLLLKRSAISLIFVMQINAHVTTEKLCHLGWSINC